MPDAPRQFRPSWAKTPKQSAREYDDRRGSARQRGYGSRWEKLRRWHLERNPLCKRCQERGHVEAAVLVDHIVPVQSADDPLFYEVENLQSLCTACHAIKTAADKAAGLTRPSR